MEERGKKKTINKAREAIFMYYHPDFLSFPILKWVREVKEIWGHQIKSDQPHHNFFGHLLWNRKASGIVIIGEMTSIERALPEPGPNSCSLDTCWHCASQREVRTLNCEQADLASPLLFIWLPRQEDPARHEENPARHIPPSNSFLSPT